MLTQDLHDLADWVPSCDVTGAAVASTGVYPMPAFEIPEQHGFDVIPLNARHARKLPFRKADGSDAGWVRQLHSHALLRGSFRPEAGIATLRACMRRPERWIAYGEEHIPHRQKALMEMPLKLHHVTSDITGATGLPIIRTVVAGGRDPDVLASFQDVRCPSSLEMIRAALVGNDRARLSSR